MKIERIEVRFVEAELEKPFGWSQRWTGVRSVIVMKVITDDGIVGWGETYGSGDSVPGIATLARVAIGEDPGHLGKIWHKLHRAVYQSHVFAKGASSAISAIDTALHDIVGKSTGKPVAEVMGGRIHDSVPVYATGPVLRRRLRPAAPARRGHGLRRPGFLGHENEGRRVAPQRRRGADPSGA